MIRVCNSNHYYSLPLTLAFFNRTRWVSKQVLYHRVDKNFILDGKAYTNSDVSKPILDGETSPIHRTKIPVTEKLIEPRRKTLAKKDTPANAVRTRSNKHVHRLEI